MKASFVIPGAIICAGVILAGALYMNLKGSAPRTASGAASVIAAIIAADHILGNPAAKVTIVEYSDFDCPHCKDFNAALHQVVNDYGTGGDVAWVFRNFPITELHPNAKKHAEAAECVAQTAGNDAYWKFADLLFANQPADPTKYAEYARAAGALPDAVASCIQDVATNGIDARIDAERQNAIDIGAQGTPYSLILVSDSAGWQTSAVIDGAWSYADLKDTVDAALQAAK